jgi:hypothetical protein
VSRFPILILLVFASLATGIGSCSPTLDQACQSQYPKFEESLSDALTVLVAWNQPLQAPDRELASLDTEDKSEPRPAIAIQDRSSWEDWAESHLKEVEHYIDLAQDVHADSVKSELSKMATEFVIFHGHAQKGNLSRMIDGLKRIDEHSAQVRNLACHQP